MSGPHDKVKVIRHQAEGKEFYRMARFGGSRQREKRFVIPAPVRHLGTTVVRLMT
jgi:hypothetical protein